MQEHNFESECTHHDHVVDESDIVEISDIGHDILSDETSDVVSDVIDIGSDGSVAVTINENEVTEDVVDIPEVDVNIITTDLTNTVSDNSNVVEDELNDTPFLKGRSTKLCKKWI